jgi:outer membrane protein OmpA-like peptidoglycan-associated protein
MKAFLKLNPWMARFHSYALFSLIMFISSGVSAASHAEDCEKARSLYDHANEMTYCVSKITLYQEAIKLCPEFAEAWNNLADAEENLGRLDDAVIHYSKAISLNPKLPEPHFSLGDIFMKQKKYRDACKSYKDSLSLCPGDQSALRSLQEAEFKLQAQGQILDADYIASRLGDMNLMGPGGTRPRVAFQILFDFNSERIKPQSHAQINEIGRGLAGLLKTGGIRYLIEGHTDNVGTAEYNQNLSLRRAESVRNFLVEKKDLPSRSFIVKGCGFERPCASNQTDEGRAQNRRVEIASEDHQ